MTGSERGGGRDTERERKDSEREKGHCLRGRNIKGRETDKGTEQGQQ